MARGETLQSFAGGVISFYMKSGTLGEGIRQKPARVIRDIQTVMDLYAPRVEAYAKTHAPWTDRTGNARNGLAARSYREGDEQGIVLFHQVPYGLWLEVRFSGRYAIIDPTIAEMGPVVMRAIEGILERR